MKQEDKCIIHIYGGLGNQMFQYVFYKYMLHLGKNACINTSYFNHRKERVEHGSEFLLSKTFPNINDSSCTDWRSETMYNDSMLWSANRIFRKLYYGKKGVLETFPLITSENLEISLEQGGVQHFRDYWQDIRYFRSIEDEIRTAFTFSLNALDKKNKECVKEMKETDSVSIHVRRGDYLKHQNIYGGICTREYYKKALELVQKEVANPRFFVFSDDIGWSRDFFSELRNVSFVYWNNKSNHLDMYLMSNCKHNIIANSSFSWWAAWLNNNTAKMVVMPHKWTQSRTSENIRFKQCIPI